MPQKSGRNNSSAVLKAKARGSRQSSLPVGDRTWNRTSAKETLHRSSVGLPENELREHGDELSEQNWVDAGAPGVPPGHRSAMGSAFARMISQPKGGRP